MISVLIFIHVQLDAWNQELAQNLHLGEQVLVFPVLYNATECIDSEY